jgi:hypothetical protein
MEYTITLSDIQYKALAHVAYDPEEWIINAVYERCRIAIEDIYQKELEKLNNEAKPVSGTKYDIVMNADIKTAKEIEDSREPIQ